MRSAISAIIEISLLLAAFILGWLKTGWPSLFYISLALIVFYVFVMVVYLIYRRETLSGLDSILGLVAITGWLALGWLIIHEKGWSIWGL